MRAGIVSIKVPIGSIDFKPSNEDVTQLKQSIEKYGLLQPIGITQKETGYHLVFGSRRIQACQELGHKYIHAVLLSIKEEEKNCVAACENIHRRSVNISTLADAMLAICDGSAEEELCLSRQQTERVKNFLLLTKDAQDKAREMDPRYIDLAAGDSGYLLRLYELTRELPDMAKEKVRLSVLSDKRIFINEIEKILKLMRQGGYQELIQEDEEHIIITKKEKTLPAEGKAI